MSSSRSSSCSASIASCSCTRHVCRKRVVGRPVGLVERSPRRVDGPVHVLFRRVGDLTERLFVGRVDVGEGAGLAVDELAVDHHLRFEATCGVSAIVLTPLLWRLLGCGRIVSQRRCSTRLRKHLGGEHHRPLRSRQRARPVAHRALSGMPSTSRDMWCIPEAGSNLLDDQQHRRIRAHTVAAERPAVVQRLDQAVGEPLRRPGELHREPTAAVHRAGAAARTGRRSRGRRWCPHR